MAVPHDTGLSFLTESSLVCPPHLMSYDKQPVLLSPFCHLFNSGHSASTFIGFLFFLFAIMRIAFFFLGR